MRWTSSASSTELTFLRLGCASRTIRRYFFSHKAGIEAQLDSGETADCGRVCYLLFLLAYRGGRCN